MEGLLIRSFVAVLLSSLIAVRAFKHQSLDRSGAFAGFLVMAIHIASGYRFGAMILVFFFTSSKLTKIGKEKKRSVEEDFKDGGQRNWIQVLCNSVIATVLVLVLSTTTGGKDRCLDTKESTFITGLIGGIIGHYACCNGDTWSSEIGMLSDGQPRLITTFKAVRKGTNGAVTIEGLLAAVAAGFVIGVTFFIAGLLTADCASDVAWRQLLVIPIAAAAGLSGSLIDSLLGATLQFSGYCSLRKKVVSRRGPTVKRISGMSILDNNAVNAVSILLTTLLTSVVCLYTF
ncbi:protein PGR-like [Typha angustifolia]|uniref:protein PGR-like n=1 Tax=Typha angustifolia TaxID=59011 RepID=UPI003C2BBD42